jgi:hypothetical protein
VSATYPNWNPQTEADAKREVCPECFTVLSISGKCACIDKE